jgi:5-methylcytosine-specific restriction endonuclease McrA
VSWPTGWTCPRCSVQHERPQRWGAGIYICPSCSVVVSVPAPPGGDGTGRSRPNSKRRRELLGKVIERDGMHCHLCGLLVDRDGTGFDKATLDHVIPRGEHGTHRLSNLRLAHAGCNMARDRLPLPIPDELRRRMRRAVRNRRRRKQREARPKVSRGR